MLVTFAHLSKPTIEANHACWSHSRLSDPTTKANHTCSSYLAIWVNLPSKQITHFRHIRTFKWTYHRGISHMFVIFAHLNEPTIEGNHTYVSILCISIDICMYAMCVGPALIYNCYKGFYYHILTCVTIIEIQRTSSGHFSWTFPKFSSAFSSFNFYGFTHIYKS